jgi:hypothetical protein
MRWWLVMGSAMWAVMCLSMGVLWRGGGDRSVERAAITRRASEAEMDALNSIKQPPLPDPTPAASSSDGAVSAWVNADSFLSTQEMLLSTREFLSDVLLPKITRPAAAAAGLAREAYLLRVARANLDIVARDMVIGPGLRLEEESRLHGLLNGLLSTAASTGAVDGLVPSLGRLRSDLVHGLRDGRITVDHPGLLDHLQLTAAGQVAIDQPSYAGLANASLLSAQISRL